MNNKEMVFNFIMNYDPKIGVLDSEFKFTDLANDYIKLLKISEQNRGSYNNLTEEIENKLRQIRVDKEKLVNDWKINFKRIFNSKIEDAKEEINDGKNLFNLKILFVTKNRKAIKDIENGWKIYRKKIESEKSILKIETRLQTVIIDANKDVSAMKTLDNIDAIKSANIEKLQYIKDQFYSIFGEDGLNRMSNIIDSSIEVNDKLEIPHFITEIPQGKLSAEAKKILSIPNISDDNNEFGM